MKSKTNFTEVIIETDIGTYCTDIMKIFGMNNNLLRHLSDARDGLKPGQRRLLYTMYKMKLKPNVNHKKVQTVLGQTMGIHPHGDSSLHGTITGLGQYWNNTLELVDGYGNFGTESGGKAAAARYIEARLSKFAWKCYFEDFDPDVVDMKMGYDGVTAEPEYLPARYPVTLFNSHFGIGYGTYCSIPPYNFNEVIDLTLELMDNPNTKNILIYPDLPTKSFIIDDGQFEEACETGDSKFRMRGEMEYHEKENMIRITSVPFQVSSKKIVADIIELMDENKLTGIKDIKNRSGKRNGICIDILLKKGTDHVAFMQTLYKKTDVQKSFSIDLRLVNDYEEIQYNVRTLLLEWINFRRGIKRRYFSHKLRKMYERVHILETLLFILDGDRLETTTNIFKTSENKEEIASRLMETYPGHVSSLQAESIANLRGYEMSKSSRKKFAEELDQLNKKDIPETESIARSAKKIDKIIKAELKEGVKLFGSPRLSKVITIENELKFRNTKHTLVFTADGLIKKLPAESEVGSIAQGDYPTRVIQCENKDKFMIFDETGRVSLLKIADIPAMDVSMKGNDIKQYCGASGRIIEIIRKPEDDEYEELMDNLILFMVSRNGLVKKTMFKDFMNMNKSIAAMIMKDNDYLQDVKLMVGDKDVLLFTNDGYGVRFNSKDIKVTSRMSMGVRSINSGDQSIIGADIIAEDEEHMLLITSKGYVKKASMETFSAGERTSKPIRIMGLNEGDIMASVHTIKEDDQFVVYTKEGGTSINCDELPVLPRLSKGKKTIGVKRGDAILFVKKVN